MTKNKSNMNKFLTGAITATMVATAIVPVAASADEIEFTDVDKTSSHYPNIIEAAERGLMTGFEGKFNPLASMTRGQVVKALGKYIVGEAGVSLDQYIADNNLLNTVTPFNDVPKNAKDQELFKYSLVVKDAEAFTGNQNNLLAANNITREQMSKVLVNAFNLSEIEGAEAKVADMDKVQGQYQGYVTILSQHGITKADNNMYNPKGDVKRQQMASFLNRSYDAVHEDDVEVVEVASVKVMDATTLSVTLSDKTVHEVTLEKALAPNVETAVTFTINDVEYTETVTWAVGLTVEKVTASNKTTIELAGTALDTLEANQLSVEGNKIVSVTANEAGDKATVVFEEEFASGKVQTLQLTTKGEDEDVVTAFTFTYKLEVSSVQATSKRVDAKADQQFLGLTVNGQPMSVKYLQDAGYTVAFQSTNPSVFKNATTGELNETNLTAGLKFAYKVVITKDDVTVESELTEVEVLDYATFLTSISEVTITQGDVTVKSGKVSVEDGVVGVKATKATTLSGATVFSPKTVTYKSSNPAVASVNATTGVVTPIKPGTVTITVSADDAKKEVPLTVVSGAREAAKATATTNSVKLLAGKTQTVDLTVVDQYGDAFKGDLTVASKDDAIAEANGATTFTDGKATATITSVAKGNTTIEVKAGDKVLANIAVAVSDDNVVATRKIETVSPSADYKLDIVPGSNDASVNLVWNQYNADGFLIGAETDFTTYTVSSSDDSVATVSEVNGIITVQAKSAGTANVVIKEGTVTKATATITVVDTTPTITSVNFESVEDVTTVGSLNAPVLKAEGIILSSTEYNAEIAKDGTIFIDVEGTPKGLDAGDITLGALSAVYSGPAANLKNFKVQNGSVTVGNVVAGSEGTIVVRVTKEGEVAAFATSTINVKVPN